MIFPEILFYFAQSTSNHVARNDTSCFAVLQYHFSEIEIESEVQLLLSSATTMAAPSSPTIKLTLYSSSLPPIRRRFFPSSFRNPPPFTCYCISTPTENDSKTSLLSTVTKPSRKVDVAAEIPNFPSFEDSGFSINGLDLSEKRGLSFDLGFERGTCWKRFKRIWYESKKVRSIILLNVITIIYGNYVSFLYNLFLKVVFCRNALNLV